MWWSNGHRKFRKWLPQYSVQFEFLNASSVGQSLTATDLRETLLHVVEDALMLK